LSQQALQVAGAVLCELSRSRRQRARWLLLQCVSAGERHEPKERQGAMPLHDGTRRHSQHGDTYIGANLTNTTVYDCYNNYNYNNTLMRSMRAPH